MAKRRSLGPILREAREEANLTQSELAARAGLAPNHVARLEASKKMSPRFDTVARLAAELGLSLDQISVDCAYVEAVRLRPKQRLALAGPANDLNTALEVVRVAEKSLVSAIASLRKEAGIPETPPPPIARKRGPRTRR